MTLRWPYDFSELDRWNVGRVPIPVLDRYMVGVGLRVELFDVYGRVERGVVTEYSRNAWVARVRLEADQG